MSTKPTIVLTAGFIEDLERLIPDPAERQRFVDDLKRTFESGEFEEQARPIDIDELEADHPEVLERLAKEDKRTLN